MFFVLRKSLFSLETEIFVFRATAVVRVNSKVLAGLPRINTVRVSAERFDVGL